MQKTAYERRISDWSSDVCSSDLFDAAVRGNKERHGRLFGRAAGRASEDFAILPIMTDTARIIALWPRWTSSVGGMQRLQILVRTQCRRCGALMRADLDELVARSGGVALDRKSGGVGKGWQDVECSGGGVTLKKKTSTPQYIQ